jgi:coproporphyrinogen III oxidase
VNAAAAALLTGCLLVTSFGTVSLAATTDERLDRLPADQQALARRLKAFAASMDEKYFARIEAINGGSAEESMTMETEHSAYDIRVTRGPIVEKAGRMLAAGKKASAGRAPKNAELVWGRFYSLDIHPKTPLVGMLHATIVLQFYDNGDSAVGGWLDVMPGTRIEDDIAVLHALVDEHFETHDKDPALYRRLVCKGTHETVAEFRRRPSCSGVSFYGPPVYRGDTEQSYAFIETLFDGFVGAFLDITENRADDPFTGADLAAQDAMRKRWLVDQLFSDPFASKVVPFEAWFMANVPPVVKF